MSTPGEGQREADAREERGVALVVGVILGALFGSILTWLAMVPHV